MDYSFIEKNNNKLMRSIHENIESKTIYLKLRKLSASELVLKLHHWAVVYMFLNVRYVLFFVDLW